MLINVVAAYLNSYRGLTARPGRRYTYLVRGAATRVLSAVNVCV